MDEMDEMNEMDKIDGFDAKGSTQVYTGADGPQDQVRTPGSNMSLRVSIMHMSAQLYVSATVPMYHTCARVCKRVCTQISCQCACPFQKSTHLPVTYIT